MKAIAFPIKFDFNLWAQMQKYAGKGESACHIMYLVFLSVLLHVSHCVCHWFSLCVYPCHWLVWSYTVYGNHALSVCTIQCSLCLVALFIVHCALFTVHFVHCSLSTVHCGTVHWSLYTMCTVHCALCTVQASMKLPEGRKESITATLSTLSWPQVTILILSTEQTNKTESNVHHA